MESREKVIKRKMGQRLRFLRNAEGSTQEEVAVALGCSPDHLSRVENGERGLSYETLLAASKYYMVSIDWIVTGRNVTDSFSKQLNMIAEYLIMLASGNEVDVMEDQKG